MIDNKNIKYNPKNPILVEVKHVHWKVGDICYFPDCVASRASKQVNSLNKLQSSLSKEVNNMDKFQFEQVEQVAYHEKNIEEKMNEQPLNISYLHNDFYNILIFFIVQRSDCTQLTVAQKIDPVFYASLGKLIQQGAIVLAMSCNVTPQSITHKALVPFIGFEDFL